MKYLYLIVFVFISLVSQAQITHTPTPAKMEVNKDSFDVKFTITYKSEFEDDTKIYWKIIKDTTTWKSSWYSYLCDNILCYDRNVDRSSPSVPNTFSTGEYKWDFHIQPFGVEGEAIRALPGDAPALQIPALMRQALLLMRLSQNRRALGVAEEAMALAEAGSDPVQRAAAVLCLAEAQLRAAAHDEALASARRAADLYQALGDAGGEGRAHWLLAFTCTRLSRNADSRQAAQRAVALCRQAGDSYGLANALKVLSFSCSDIQERLEVLRQAGQAFERAGHLSAWLANLEQDQKDSIRHLHAGWSKVAKAADA